MSFKAQEKPNFREMTPEQTENTSDKCLLSKEKQLMEDAATMMAIKLTSPCRKQEALNPSQRISRKSKNHQK